MVLFLKTKQADAKGRSRLSRRDAKKAKEEEKQEEDDDHSAILPRYRTWEEAQAAVEDADR